MNKFTLIYNLALNGIYLAKADSSYEQLIDFISLLRPVDINIPLIRVGSDNDGGYLIPDDYLSCRALISPGVGDNSDFEFFFAAKGIPCWLFDYSVQSAARSHHLFTFVKKFVGLPLTPDFISLDQAVSMIDESVYHYPQQLRSDHVEHCSSADYILSMDIEGSELESLLDVSDETLNRFRIITLELHFLHRVIHQPVLLLYRTLMTRLKKFFHICHLHPTNAYKPISYLNVDIPVNIELTLVHKSRVLDDPLPPSTIHHKLDAPTIPAKPDVNLSPLYLSQHP